MTVIALYDLQTKMARRESVCKQNPMNNNRVLCGFVQYFGYLLPYGGENICNSSDAGVCGNPGNARAKFGYGGVR